MFCNTKFRTEIFTYSSNINSPAIFHMLPIQHMFFIIIAISIIFMSRISSGLSDLKASQ